MGINIEFILGLVDKLMGLFKKLIDSGLLDPSELLSGF